MTSGYSITFDMSSVNKYVGKYLDGTYDDGKIKFNFRRETQFIDPKTIIEYRMWKYSLCAYDPSFVEKLPKKIIDPISKCEMELCVLEDWRHVWYQGEIDGEEQ